MSGDTALSRHVCLLLFILLCCTSAAVCQSPIVLNVDNAAMSEPQRTQLHEDDPVSRALPNPADPQLRLPLKCSACGAVVEHAVHLLAPAIRQHVERRSRAGSGDVMKVHPKEFEVVDAIEILCNEVSQMYGLEMLTETDTSLFFTKSAAVGHVTGGWIAFFLASTCEELLDEQEEELISAIFTASGTTAESDLPNKVREMVCTQWSRVSEGCNEHGEPIDPRSIDTSDL